VNFPDRAWRRPAAPKADDGRALALVDARIRATSLPVRASAPALRTLSGEVVDPAHSASDDGPARISVPKENKTAEPV